MTDRGASAVIGGLHAQVREFRGEIQPSRAAPESRRD